MGDQHVRAGQRGGSATKRNKGGTEYYRRIGSLGGKATMERHGDEYQQRRIRGGLTTKQLHGLEHYRRIGAISAQTRQERIRLRNEVMALMLADGWKIPTLIQLTLQDVPRLERYLDRGLAAYLAQRPPSDTNLLFVSQSGKPLALANTYTVMERYRRHELRIEPPAGRLQGE